MSLSNDAQDLIASYRQGRSFYDQIGADGWTREKREAERIQTLKDSYPDSFLFHIHAVTIDSTPQGTLHITVDTYRDFEEAYYVSYHDPSTGQLYVAGIDPEIGKECDADLAQAWRLGLTKEQYMELVEKGVQT